ncbi:MAG: hypothetical protein IPG18_17170 [Saprospiraceae bacterium]|nr:hypothetical protein [Saprospiraceae bacterium]
MFTNLILTIFALIISFCILLLVIKIIVEKILPDYQNKVALIVSLLIAFAALSTLILNLLKIVG